MYSEEHVQFLKKIKLHKFLVLLAQFLTLIIFLTIWELLSKYEIINPFLYSSPIKAVQTISQLFQSNDLINHIYVTSYETVISFILASIIGFGVSTILWWNRFIFEVIDPYLTVLNSLPKVALGPLIIIWVGATTKSIIIMALLISTFISIINIYNGFISVDSNLITLMKSMKASKLQVFYKVILPSNLHNIINAFKINISMSLIGVIMGELLVSKQGLGYLIMYGSQVFNINLVITSVVILGIVSYLMYYVINWIEKKSS